jgi:hypothetical protein
VTVEARHPGQRQPRRGGALERRDGSNVHHVVENEPTIDKRWQSMKTDKADAMVRLRLWRRVSQ